MNTLNKLLPEIEEFIKIRSPNTAGVVTPETKRKAYSDYSKLLRQVQSPDIEISNLATSESFGSIPLRMYRRKGLDGLLPCVLYFHGGGFMVGDLDSSEVISSGIAEQVDCISITVDYPLSPESPFPAAFNASYACLEWIAKHGADVGIDASRVVLVGDSAGANIAAAMCMQSRDQGGPKILSQILVNPWLSAQQSHPSRQLFASGYGLTSAALADYQVAYLNGNSGTEDFRAFPLNATNYENLPPTWIHNAERDPLRDDGRLFADAMIAAGNDVCYHEARGCVHAFLRARFLGDGTAAEFRRFTRFVTQALTTF